MQYAPVSHGELRKRYAVRVTRINTGQGRERYPGVC